MLTKANDFLVRGAWEEAGKGTQESCWAMWLTGSGFMVMGLVSEVSLPL